MTYIIEVGKFSQYLTKREIFILIGMVVGALFIGGQIIGSSL